jgi:hypothetical protein
MKFIIDDWKAAWSWPSVHGYLASIAASVTALAQSATPETVKAATDAAALAQPLVSPRLYAWLVLGISVYGLLGRFVRQQPKA